MIKAFLFDLDGTLIQTESLKALSYAKAAVDLDPDNITEDDVVNRFREVVGLSRREVSIKLLDMLDLEKQAREKMKEYDVSEPWQAFVQIRLNYYDKMISDPKIVKKFFCPFSIGLLRWTISQNYDTALATMSHCEQARNLLGIMGLKDKFKFIASRDDVENGKPDPEIYNLLAEELNVKPGSCLVIEDSPAGIQAAVNADMYCVAVTNDFTRENVHRHHYPEDVWIVDNLETLQSEVKHILSEIGS